MGYHLLLASLGGAIGAAARYLVGIASVRLLGFGFPWGTMFVNIVGSLAMGLLVGYLAKRSGTPEAARIFMMTGILGGFTTFSAFSLDAVSLYQRGELGQAFGYITASVVFSIAALFAGLMLVRGATS